MTRPFQQMTADNCSICYQGDAIINDVRIITASPTLVALSVDMKTKYVAVGGMGAVNDIPHIVVVCTEPGKDSPTSVAFIDYLGWEVFAVYAARYTINVCLIKK